MNVKFLSELCGTDLWASNFFGCDAAMGVQIIFLMIDTDVVDWAIDS